MAQAQQPDDAKISKLVSQKMDLVAQIKQLQAELGKLNSELHRSGAAEAVVICW